MIDLKKKVLPNTVTVGGRAFSIYTDYRIWLRFVVEFEHWQKKGLKGTLDIKYLFKNEIPVFECKADYDGIFDFAFPKNVIPHSDSSRGEQVLFYDVDGDYIYSAFMQQYGIDLIDIKELHWHKFKALLNGIGKPTKLNEIMSYRAYTGEHVKAEDQYRKLKEAWMPPYIPTEEEIEAEKEFEDYFG